jgi:hypothetical protein
MQPVQQPKPLPQPIDDLNAFTSQHLISLFEKCSDNELNLIQSELQNEMELRTLKYYRLARLRHYLKEKKAKVEEEVEEYRKKLMKGDKNKDSDLEESEEIHPKKTNKKKK